MKTIDEQLYNILNEYTEELADEAKDAFKTTAKETASELKSTSEALFHHKAQKHYADGWRYRVKGTGLDLSLTVYNALKPGLTHLLENGHMILIDGVNHGRSKVFKHIEPAEKKAFNLLMQRLQK